MIFLPKIVEIKSDKIIAKAALKVKKLKSDAPGNWYSFSKNSNK
jgi:hypothetical protein